VFEDLIDALPRITVEKDDVTGHYHVELLTGDSHRVGSSSEVIAMIEGILGLGQRDIVLTFNGFNPRELLGPTNLTVEKNKTAYELAVKDVAESGGLWQAFFHNPENPATPPVVDPLYLDKWVRNAVASVAPEGVLFFPDATPSYSDGAEINFGWKKDGVEHIAYVVRQIVQPAQDSGS